MPDETLHLRVDDQIDIRRADRPPTIVHARKRRNAPGVSPRTAISSRWQRWSASISTAAWSLAQFLPSGEAVAMSFAFLGKIEGRLCLYSQLTGVVPEHQSRGLGHEIKRFQRQIALAEGIEHIAWAFDPLQAGNAHFNLSRLGAHAARFVANMYGERTDRLNAGVPSDRLIAEWDLAVEPPCPALLRFRQRGSPLD